MKSIIIQITIISIFIFVSCAPTISDEANLTLEDDIFKGIDQILLNSDNTDVNDPSDIRILNAEKEDQYSIVTESFLQDKVEVKYPQIQGLGDDERERAINELIKKDLFRTQIDYQLEDVKRQLERGIDEYYYLELEYEIKMQSDKILSILYTGKGAYKTSHFPTYSIYGITIGLEQVEKLHLLDFIEIDKDLIELMKISTNVTNGAIKDKKDKESLLEIVQMVISQEEDFIIRALHGELDGYYTYAVSTDSLFISFALSHASGDYALVEIPYEHTIYQ